MKKAYSKSSRQGLPGGPNEMFQKVKGIIVSERGQWDFPGMTTLVPTQDGRITMRGVPYPVLGQDETGYTQMMYPEQEYQFPGQNVLELPMAQNGLTVSQIWEQKTGIPWSEAKNKGYTSGSFDDNINLRKQLLSGNFELNQTSQSKPLVTNTSTNVISVNANSFSEAFKQARNQLGANKIFIWNGRKYGTNLAGEDFKPDEQTLSEAGLNNKQTKQRLETENKKLQDPYIGKSTVKLEGDWKDLEEVKTDKKQYEKSSQAERIIRYKNENKDNKNYVIVDKEKGLLHIYKPGQSKPIFTSGIDLGRNIGDDQTVTKALDTNKDGIITEADKVKNRWVVDWEKGSGTTGAGRYYISNITKNSVEPGYAGYPTLNMMNERQYDEFKKSGKAEQVSTMFHKGYVVDDNNRVSNGCIRCNRTTLNNLVEQLSNSSEVYILPEDRDEQGNLVNEFVYENGKLNFRTKDYKKYLTYKDSKGQTQKGQGLNRTEQTLNYKPITLGYDPNRLSILSNSNHNETVVEDFSEALSDNKQKIMKVAQINGDVYNEIAKMAFGILGAETNWGETFNLGENVVKGIGRMITGKVGGPDYSFKAAVGRTDDDDSVGLTQLKWKWVSAKEREKLKELGITSSEDFLDPQKAAIGTAVILGIRYNEQLKTEDKANLWETLPGKWNNRPNYARRIKFNSAPVFLSQYTGDSKKGDLIKQNYKKTKAQNIIKEQIQQDSSKPFVAESTRGSLPIRNINFEQISFPNRKFGGALPKAQPGLQVPIERPDALRVHMNIDPNAKYEEKKKSDVLDLDNALDYLVETRGGTRDLWGRMADTIGYHESWHTMDPLKLQSNDGPGRGIFQFEPPSLITAQNRYRRIADRLSLKTDPEILNAKSAIELSPEQQYALFLINIAESKAPLKDYADNKLSLVDLWLQGHKNVERVGNRESFRTSVQKAKNESIQKGYDSFKKLGGSLPKAQMLGQFNPQLFQPNPLTGRYNWEKPKAKPQLRDFEPKQKAAERSSTNVATKPDPIKAARQINAAAVEEYERNRGVIRNAPVRASSYFKPGGYDPTPLAEYTGVPSIMRIAQNPESINDFLTGVDQLLIGSSPVSGMMGLRREFTPEEIQAMSDYFTVAAMAAPLAKGAVNLGAKGLRQAGRYATTQTPLRNAYKYNPWAFKADPKAAYRMLGDEGFDDAIQVGYLRAKPSAGKWNTQTGKVEYGTPNYEHPYFSVGKPWDKNLVPGKPHMGYKGPYMAELKNQKLIENDLGYSTGRNNIFRPEEQIFTDNPNLRFYKEDWLRGYKPIEVPRQLPGSPKAVSVVDDVSRVVADTPQPWKMQELPGLHLKSTMTDGPISKIVEPKTGLINTEQALAIIGKESGGADKVALIRQGLGENIPAKMDYNEFRKVVQDQLIPLETKINPYGRSEYGLHWLGYVDNQPIERKSLTFSNKNKFGRGSSAHRNPEETLGHAHFLRDAETPDVLTVTQIQSDAFQGTHRIMPDKSKLNDKIKNLEQHLTSEGRKLAEKIGGKEAADLNEKAAKELLEKYKKEIKESLGPNPTQKQLLDKTHQERYLQELVDYAASRGDINKMRLPTSETASKVQGFGKHNNVIQHKKELLSRADNQAVKKQLEKELTILKKYSEQPKTIKKLFGKEPTIVTDSKGNTWYEFDIPEKFKQGKGEIKAFQRGGSKLKPYGMIEAYPGESGTGVQGDVGLSYDLPTGTSPYLSNQFSFEPGYGSFINPGFGIEQSIGDRGSAYIGANMFDNRPMINAGIKYRFDDGGPLQTDPVLNFITQQQPRRFSKSKK